MCWSMPIPTLSRPCDAQRNWIGIRLAGATCDVHVFDVKTGKWEKITPLGEAPSPRAAHAAAAVGNMVVVQVRRAAVGVALAAGRVRGSSGFACGGFCMAQSAPSPRSTQL